MIMMMIITTIMLISIIKRKVFLQKTLILMDNLDIKSSY